VKLKVTPFFPVSLRSAWILAVYSTHAWSTSGTIGDIGLLVCIKWRHDVWSPCVRSWYWWLVQSQIHVSWMTGYTYLWDEICMHRFAYHRDIPWNVAMVQNETRPSVIREEQGTSP
jgi:hypothetical protein